MVDAEVGSSFAHGLDKAVPGEFGKAGLVGGGELGVVEVLGPACEKGLAGLVDHLVGIGEALPCHANGHGRAGASTGVAGEGLARSAPWPARGRRPCSARFQDSLRGACRGGSRCGLAGGLLEELPGMANFGARKALLVVEASHQEQDVIRLGKRDEQETR